MSDLMFGWIMPQISKNLPIPYDLAGYFKSLETVFVLVGFFLGWKLFKLKGDDLVFTISITGIMLFLALLGNFILVDEYIVEYHGQSVIEMNSNNRVDDKIIVILPIIRQKSLEDYYPGGRRYEETPGVQALAIFENKKYKSYVRITKLLYLLDFIIIVLARTILVIYLFLSIISYTPLFKIFKM